MIQDKRYFLPAPLVSTLLVLCVMLSIGCKGKEQGMAPPASVEPRRPLPFYPDHSMAEVQSNKGALEFDEAAVGVFDGNLPCDDAENCDGATEVHFKIIPEKRAHVAPMEVALLRPPNQAYRGGYIVAKIRNMDPNHRFGAFNMEKGETAYLWAGPTKLKGNRFAIYRIPDNQPAVLLAAAAEAKICRRSGYSHSEVHTPPAEQCLHYDPIYPEPPQPAANPVAFDSEAPVFLASNPIRRPTLLSVMMHTQGLWISCSGGCCQAGGWAPM